MRKFLDFCITVVTCFVVLSAKVDQIKNDNEIHVRAVFLNCVPDEGQSTLPDHETTWFENEEHFKHSALRDCTKKLGISVKLTSDANDDSDDVYIPIDHVLYGPKRKRIRLLNPYVLRLRWEPPLQAYKLLKIDTVNGVLTSSDDAENKETRKLNRFRRELEDSYWINDKEKDPVLEVKNKLDGIDKNLIRSNDKDQIIRSKYSNVENSPEYHCEIPGIFEDTARVTTDSSYEWSLYNDDNQKDISPKYGQPMNFNRSNIEKEAYRSYNKKTDFTANDHNPDNEGSLPDEAINKSTSERSTETFYEDKHINANQNDFIDSLTSDEKSYILYEIGDPDLLQNVRVQMYEKLINPGGNIVWNDVIKGQKASVSSISPNWSSEDMNIRYQPAEWVPREEFLLPMTNLCLLASTRNSDTEEPNNSINSPDCEEYIVVPLEDIVGIEEITNLDKRNSNSFKLLTSSTSNWKLQPGHHRVKIRTTRALFGNKEMNLGLLLQENKEYLTLPYKRAHRAQIDLEIRADDNQLVYVGQFGRITTAVSDCTRRSRATLILQVTNTGLAASRFKTIIRDCGPILSELFNSQKMPEIATNPLTIPPKHTRRFELELPTEIPPDIAHCSVALINDDNVPVALRDVTIKKGDRCFCVWHCDCVCLSEDPKLICQEMPESRQIAAGLTMRDRYIPRRVRSLRYNDCDSVNIFVAIFGMLFTLLLFGFIKALLGLLCACVRAWGLTRMFKSPPKLDRYFESSLNSRPVEYDTEGWPVHPDTKKRTVHLCSWQMEFILNVIFFLVMPWVIICDSIKELKMHIKGLDQTDTDKPFNKNNKKCFSSHDVQSTEASRSCRHRKRGLRRWMTPQAEKLSTDVWETALTHREPIKCEFMRPLLHGDRHRDDNAHLRAQDSYIDSEQEDTEYVLMQMQKSKEVLTKNSRKFNDGE